MPICHYRLTADNQRIQIPNTIHGQRFTFRRAVVRMVPLAAGTPSTNLKGGVIVSPSHFSGFEIVSGTTIDNTTDKPITNNLGANDILIGVDEYRPITTEYYSMGFDSETVNQGFTVKVFNFDREKVTFGTQAGQLTSIDIYFEFASLYDYQTY